MSDKVRRLPWKAVTFSGLGVLAVVAVVSNNPGGGGSASSSGTGMARVMCERFVEDRLVSPSSADFDRPDATSLGGGEYRVAGIVDADNRMGAAIRIDYTCKVRHVTGDEWSLVDLQTSER